MKKFLSILLCFTIFVCLVACGATETNSNTTDTHYESQNDVIENATGNTSSEETSVLQSDSSVTSEEQTYTEEKTSVLQSDPSVTSEEQTYTEEKTFIPGKELICPQGNTFSLYGQAFTLDMMTMSEKRENYKVEISSFKAVMLKEADINNLDDYLANRTFFPYIYEIEIVGKIDSKYANKTTTIGVRFPVDGDLTFYDSYFNNDPSFVGQFVTINADGSFKLKTRVGFCSVQDTIMITSVYSY